MARLQCTYKQAHAAARKKINHESRTGEWQYECWIDGRFWFKVSIPDGGGHQTAQIPPGTLGNIVRQLQLSREEFVEWRDCPMGKDQYEQLMRQRLASS